ncbi:hypothetical protein EYF80_034424 [Liparis tanakae]|uniref:Uncharacterized protein n=1 Tax=Liparis tanakae TaxID=230148 RepID=A0A4Z2GPZ1_9TELE|nr:hypothetical protein EYF80_034424 [Liparis tanakae]
MTSLDQHDIITQISSAALRHKQTNKSHNNDHNDVVISSEDEAEALALPLLQHGRLLLDHVVTAWTQHRCIVGQPSFPDGEN